MTRGMTSQLADRIAETGLPLQDFFEMPAAQLVRTLMVSESCIMPMDIRNEALFNARRELDFVERHHIQTLFYGQPGYPVRLGEIPDAPLVLYKLGSADLDEQKALGWVGTRRATRRGIETCAKLIKEISDCGFRFSVISGLALGIDAAAHRAALDCGEPTVAVVAHGLNTIYPTQNRELAKRILASGGAIVSEYPSGTKPYRQNFLFRNRIVAGLSDGVVVVESPVKGGAMSTGTLAFGYNRALFAIPGRPEDEMSRGCNLLIRKNKAMLADSGSDIMEELGWKAIGSRKIVENDVLKPELTGIQAEIYSILKDSRKSVSFDDLHHLLNKGNVAISVPELMAALGEMEFDGVIAKLPGNRFETAF